jgi:hypothetical protein
LLEQVHARIHVREDFRFALHLAARRHLSHYSRPPPGYIGCKKSVLHFSQCFTFSERGNHPHSAAISPVDSRLLPSAHFSVENAHHIPTRPEQLLPKDRIILLPALNSRRLARAKSARVDFVMAKLDRFAN